MVIKNPITTNHQEVMVLWARNKQNHENKKKAKLLLMDQVKKLESKQAPKPDKKGKGKAPKMANLLGRIDEEILLIDRMEDIDNYNERVFCRDSGCAG